MAVEIQKTIPKHNREQAWLKRRAQHLIRALCKCPVPGAAALKKAELSILLTTNEQIQHLNRDWRGKNKATDVLSFPQVEVAELRALGRMKRVPEWWLGDIVISVEKAKEQAKERGHSLQVELETLLAHGLLHLLGYDHELGAAEARKMRLLENKLLGRSMIEE